MQLLPEEQSSISLILRCCNDKNWGFLRKLSKTLDVQHTTILMVGAIPDIFVSVSEKLSAAKFYKGNMPKRELKIVQRD